MTGEKSNGDTGLWPRVRQLGAIIGVSAVTLVVGACGDTGESGPDRSTAVETPEIPEQASDPPLDLRGIFVESVVSDEALPVAELGSGVCAGVDTKHSFGPMYRVDTQAVDDIIAAIEKATAGLNEAREAGAMLAGKIALDDRPVFLQLGFDEPAGSPIGADKSFLLVGDEQATSPRPTRVYISTPNPAGGPAMTLQLLMEATPDSSASECSVFQWVGSPDGILDDTGSQAQKFALIADAASTAERFVVEHDPRGDAPMYLEPATPNYYAASSI